MIQLFMLFILVSIVGCSSTINSAKPQPTKHNNIAREYVVGTWYNQRTLFDGTLEQTKIENFNDGTYRIKVKSTYRNGLTSNSIELGQWGVSGNILFTIFRGWVEGCSIVSTDAESNNTYNAYNIDLLTTSRVKFHHVSNNKHFYLEKVADDFILAGGEDAMINDCSYLSKSIKRNKAPV